MLDTTRIATALQAVILAAAPALALAQQAGDGAPGDRSYGWLWMIAAALVLAALFRLIFSGGHSHDPPARQP